MIKAILMLFLSFNLCFALAQVKDTTNMTTPLIHRDSAFSFQVEIPSWLNLKDTGTKYIWGGTLPLVEGIENAVVIKIFDKSKYQSLPDFRKFIVEDLQFGQTPSWSKSHKFVGKKDLGKYNKIGDAYKVYLMRGQLIYHCEYVLLETSSSYLWIDFTATPETFDKNIGRFDEFMRGFKIMNL